MTWKLAPPSVLRAIGTSGGNSFWGPRTRYVRKRLPVASNERLGSQHATPRLSPFPMMLVVHVAPPSLLTPSNIPTGGLAILDTITMFRGSFGFTAMVVSDSFPERRLTSTLGAATWLVGFGAAEAPEAGAMATAARIADVQASIAPGPVRAT